MKILKRGELVIFDPDHRNIFDRRVKEVFAVFEYFDEDGVEYRKSFKQLKGTTKEQMMEMAPLVMRTT
jgi:hypothetical protein